ncbi:MAG: hypothetical protein V2J02_22435 [Pseudomonadales bacterium]|nr:hypothetical protein [Pseudomonadales bacterium]
MQIDQDLAGSARAEGCACGGRLHSANYPRKPRCGLDLQRIDPLWSVRFSLCCDAEGCRRRTTPPSVRFLGRRVYVGLVVLLIAVLAESATPARRRRLQQLVGDVSARTIERWRRWWREAFVETGLWWQIRARLPEEIDTARLPGALLDRFSGDGLAGRVVALLRALTPLTVPRSDAAEHAS